MKVIYEAYREGILLLFLVGNVLRIQPPLVIGREDLDRACRVLERL